MKNNVSLTCITMVIPTTGWFEIVKIPTYDLNEVTGDNDEYIDESSARVSQLSNNTWLIRYLLQRKFMFDNRSNFKPDFTPLQRIVILNLS